MKKIIVSLLLLLIIASCKTITNQSKNQKITDSAVELLTIGNSNSKLSTSSFSTDAIPVLKQKIRINASELTFNKTLFKSYDNSAKLQGKENPLTYIDSIPQKPSYILLKIMDKVTLIEELNSDYNKTVFEYLKSTAYTQLISEISIVFDERTKQAVKNAEEIFIINEKYKKYSLALYKNGEQFEQIELSKGITFSYKLSTFCWAENKRKQGVIVNIVDKGNDCSPNTYDSYQEIEKKHSFKF